jgi:RNA polymerase sigma-70 factor (ECF subfamily)
MQGNGEPATRSTLLYRLRDLSDQQAWNEFVERYAPKIYGWCRRYRLQEADAADVTQDVLGRMVAAIRRFEYDPARGSFRGWLKTVTSNLIRDLAQSWSRPGRGQGGGGPAELAQAPAALTDLTALLEAEAEQDLLREAEERVRLRVQAHTWQAYALTAVERQPAAAVARQLNLTVSDVYVAKSRVIKLLRQEVEKLSEPAGLIRSRGSS